MVVEIHKHPETIASQNASRPHEALAEHRRILEAIADRDGELAELLIRRHLAASRRSIADQLGDRIEQEDADA